MIHNFKYTLKTLFKNKMLIFWTFAFPLILGSFFKMAFSSIEENEKLSIIPIAIIDNENFRENQIAQEVFSHLSEENENQLLYVKYVTQEEATSMLEKEEIEGYIEYSDTPKITIRKNGINQTILKYVTEEITEQEKISNQIVEKKIEGMVKNNRTDFYLDQTFYQNLHTEIEKMLEENDANIVDISSKNLSYTMIEYYSLIAMACLYGGILGMISINQNLPNMSSSGKRVSVSPTKKSSMLISSILASFLTQLVGIALLFLYTIFVLKVDYGNNLALIILLAVVGSLAGLSLGVVIASSLKSNENTKLGIVISLTMLGSFLSGMMGITMKYIVDKNIPLLNQINPANRITDGFYSLYYYDTLDRYLENIFCLLLFSLIMFGIACYHLRRQKYDSI